MADHAGCAALAPKRAETEPAPVAEPRLVVDGVAAKKRSGVLVNGERRSLQDGKLVILLRLAIAHDRAPGTWSDRNEIGIGPSHNATIQLREVFAGLVPEGLEAIEGDGRGNVRLNPAVVVERIEIDALAEHADPAVKRVATEEKRRRGRA
jgi:hypothetical protein